MKMIDAVFKLILRFAFVLLVLFSCERDQRCDGGLLWRISGNGLKEPSFLLGTNHGMSGDFLDSIPRFFEILDSVKQLAVEYDFTKAQKLDSIKPINKYLPTGTTYRDLLNDYEIAVLDSVLSKYSPLNSEKMNLTPGRLLYMLNMNMIRKESRQWAKENPFLFVDFRRNIELRLLRIAKFRYYPIIELDTVEELNRLGLWDMSIWFSSDKLPNQASEMISMIKEEGKDTLRMFIQKKVMEAYYKQDLAEMEKWFTHSAILKDEKARAIYYTLTTTRNIFWLDKILTSINRESTLIAVGAAHLPGKKGVINLLREEGYIVEPVK